MKRHIENLTELKRLFCSDCIAKKQGWARCLSIADNCEPCDYVKSLFFAISLIKRIDTEFLTKEKQGE